MDHLDSLRIEKINDLYFAVIFMKGKLMDLIEILKKHGREIRERYGVKRIGVFGSYARGEQKKTSDIDVLVEFDKPTFDNFMNLSFYLEALLGKEVDLVTTKGMSQYIIPIVEKEVVWCE